MKIAVAGGGPAGLYFSLLARQALPEAKVTVFERNRADDTYGWGVVFSDETLGSFRHADPPTYAEITSRFRYWQDIETHYRNSCTVSTGHGFAALERRELLLILQERCRELEVDLRFESEIEDPAALTDYDLVVGADGVNSLVRRRWADRFHPYLDWRRCKFTWLGTTKPLTAFTFIFKETSHGLFVVHAYPFAEELSTWIVECRDEVWRRAGLDQASEEETLAFCEALFGDDLEGHRLLANRSLWRSFPTVQCETWHHDNVVLIGDAAHTAHFSVGSGTKLAMEDAIALVNAFAERGTQAVPDVLAAYEEERWVDVVKLQKAAQTSLEWFENAGRYMGQHPLQLTFNLMTRSKRITYDNLRQRDPALVTRLNDWYRENEGAPKLAPDTAPPPPMLTPLTLRGLTLNNRIVVSPMCQYSAVDGTPQDWHLVHLGSRAVGGAGLVITEMTDVTPEGRITHGCAGIYRREHVAAWQRIVDFVHRNSRAKIGIQLAHAGRKASCHRPWEQDGAPLGESEGAWQALGPSALPFAPHWPTPKAVDAEDMAALREAFVRATRWALEAGFDLIELHMAHGYLLSSFLSPLCNQRQDAYGGSLENRLRFPLEVLHDVRAAWPQDKPLSVRLSACDWMSDDSGMTLEDTVHIARALATAGCDIIDVSSGGNSPLSMPLYGRMYQTPFADQVRHEAGVPVMTVGALQGGDHANTVLAAGRADLAVMARAHLRDPYLTLHAAVDYEQWQHPWPNQYVRARPLPKDEGRRPLRDLSTPGNRGRREVEEPWRPASDDNAAE